MDSLDNSELLPKKIRLIGHPQKNIDSTKRVLF